MDRDAGETLRAAVADALGRRVAAIEDVESTPLEYDAFLAHRAVSRLRGSAVVDGERVPWSLIEKRTEGPALATPYLLDNGRRELAAYTSGLLDDLAPGVRAPRAFGTRRDQDGAITLLLEEIHRDGARQLDPPAIVASARDLGAMSGRWVGRDLTAPWLFTGWIDRHAQPEAVARGLTALQRVGPDAAARLPGRIDPAERLIIEQPRVREILQSLPLTLCHHDAVGANLFRSGEQTVLIDWESVGPGPVGADLASLLFSSVRRGDASAAVVAAALDDAVRAYAAGVRSESSEVSLADVRRGFEASIALRWKLAVDVVIAIDTGPAFRRGSLPDETPEAALAESILLVDLLLDSAARVLEWTGHDEAEPPRRSRSRGVDR